MKKIQPFSLSRLHVKERSAFAAIILEIVEELHGQSLIPALLVENLRGAINVHSNATVGKTSKLLTQAARQLDRERDETIRAIKGLIRVSRYRHDEARRQAGVRLEEAIRHRGWEMQDESLASETTSVEQLLNDIQDSPALGQAVDLLDGRDLVDHLAALNLRFEENEQLRRAYALAHAVTSTEATASLNHALAKVLAYVNAVAGTSSEIDHAIDLINIRSKPYNELLKARDTCARKKKGPKGSGADEQPAVEE